MVSRFAIVAALLWLSACGLPGNGSRILDDFSEIENTYIVELATRNIVDQAQDPFSLYPYPYGL